MGAWWPRSCCDACRCRVASSVSIVMGARTEAGSLMPASAPERMRASTTGDAGRRTYGCLDCESASQRCPRLHVDRWLTSEVATWCPAPDMGGYRGATANIVRAGSATSRMAATALGDLLGYALSPTAAIPPMTCRPAAVQRNVDEGHLQTSRRKKVRPLVI